MEDGTREWLDELLPFEDLSMDWRPSPGAPCAGGILLHIMAAERFWIDMVAHGRELTLEDPALEYDSRLDQYAGIWPDPPEQPFSWYLDLLRTHRARTIELIKEHNDPDRVHQKDEYADFDFAWIVGHLVQHDSYHGGQIVLLNELRKVTKQKGS